MSLDALAAQGLPETTTLLRLLSFLAADPVPLSLLAPLARGEFAIDGLEPSLSAAQLEPALRGLLDHSLAELVEADGTRCLRAHGVLLDSVAAGVPEGQRPLLAETAAGLLEAVLPEEGVESPDTRSRLSLLAAHSLGLLEKAPSERTIALAARTARHMFDSGDFAAALEVAPGVAERSEAVLGREHPVALDVRFTEAMALYRMGHYTESEVLHRRVLGVRERVLGPDHPDTLRSCFGLTWPLFLAGRVGEAETWARRALDGQRRVLGESAPETLYTWTNVIELLPHLGKGQEFDTETEALLRACESALPPDHVTTVIAWHSYAEGLRVLGRYEEAEPLARRVLADRIRVHGPDHPLVLSALCLKARVASGLGRFGEAVEIFTELIERRERVLGPEHPFTVGDRERLAACQAEAQQP